jgi:hypothetical protein
MRASLHWPPKINPWKLLENKPDLSRFMTFWFSWLLSWPESDKGFNKSLAQKVLIDFCILRAFQKNSELLLRLRKILKRSCMTSFAIFLLKGIA